VPFANLVRIRTELAAEGKRLKREPRRGATGLGHMPIDGLSESAWNRKRPPHATGATSDKCQHQTNAEC